VATSLVEKYEQILAADPRSRIFVELARALVERGDHARAIEVCRAGLEHHPSSIQGRVTWGRALLEAGDLRSAQDQFEIAIGIDPANPYAYNLVGEALTKKGHFREALPTLKRATELQPADPKVKAALEEAQRRARGGTTPAMPAMPAPGSEPSQPGAAPGAPGDPPASSTQLGLPAVAPEGEKTEELTLRLSLDPPAPAGPVPPLRLGALEPEEEPPAEPEPAVAAAPPPPAEPRAKRGPPGPSTLLRMIPPAEASQAPARPRTPAPDSAEAARIAADYERTLRKAADEAASGEPPPPPRRRALLAAVALLVVGGGAIGVYLYVQDRTRTQEAGRAVEAARAGLARDTKASLAKAAEVLAAARAAPPSSPVLRSQLLSLSAQVAALRAVDHGEEGARAEAATLADDPQAGDGGLVARYLLAERSPERSAAEATLLAARPGDAPMVQRLAGQILVGRGELESGRGRLRIAAQATPPLLGALADLGDSYLTAGDAEAALPLYEAALAAHPTHPRAVIGAAEARLALERPLDASRRELAAVEQDPGSAPPLKSRLRFELASARVQAALGDATGAARRLTLAAGALGDSAGLEATRAELLLGARSFGPAEEAAARAVRLDPKAPEHRVLLARARLGLHRYQPALQALQGPEGRNTWLVRGIALLGLGQAAQARAALEKTVRGGKMPSEAAAWYALCDLSLGRTTQAVELLDKLAAARNASALVHAARGRALLAAKRHDDAIAACRLAIGLAPKAPDGPLCLGRVLLAQSKQAEAVAPLEQAVALDPADPEAAKLLAAAKAPPKAAKAAPARAAAKPAPKKR
jgi:tetratricopeptide (TPR) repeat protein